MRFLRRWRRERQASTKIIELKLYTNCSSMNTSLVSCHTQRERRRIFVQTHSRQLLVFVRVCAACRRSWNGNSSAKIRSVASKRQLREVGRVSFGRRQHDRYFPSAFHTRLKHPNNRIYVVVLHYLRLELVLTAAGCLFAGADGYIPFDLFKFSLT